MDPNLIKKIKDLVSLSKSSNVNEAANAWAMAQKLLTKHRLTLLELEQQSSAAELVEGEMSEKGQRIVTWKNVLANNIAMLNGAKMFIEFNWVNNKKIARYKLIGRESDIQIVNYLYSSIVQQIEALSANALREGVGSGKTFTNSFKLGAVNRVIERLRKAQEELKEELSDCQAMVLLDNRYQEAEEKFKCDCANIKKLQRPKVNYDLEGYFLGQDAGEEVSLNPGLQS